jgi:antirestriction protein ArdC
MPKRPDIRNEKQQAYYNRAEDYVNVPKMGTFTTSESYYGTLFHELVHCTGHSERLNRLEMIKSKGMRSEGYAKEELTAEMGASYLKSFAGIPIEKLENNAAYIQHWLERLKNDKRFIVNASTQAQKATDFILNIGNERELEIADNTFEKPDKSAERVSELNETRSKVRENSIIVER